MMKNQQLKIGDITVGDNSPTFIIAEAGANHNGDIGLALEMIKEAKKIGADCIKFQTFTAEQFCADKTKKFTYFSKGKKIVESELEMLKRFEFSEENWKIIMKACDDENITFLTTIQDPPNLQMMLKLGLKGIKVGSDDFDHITNLEVYAKSGLPLILSKGMSEIDETKFIIEKLQKKVSGGLAILHCVSLYPTDPEHLNIKQIITLKNLFPNIIWGFSDHSQSVIAPAIAVSLGASIIEKHFTLDHDLPGPDHWFSMDPNEFKQLVDNVRYCEKSLGNGEIILTDKEINQKKIMRRRILVNKNLEKGTILNLDNVSFKRAEEGIFAFEWQKIKGRKINVNKNNNEPIFFDDLS